MYWKEITLNVPRDAADAASAIFYDAGAKGVVVDDPLTVNNYIDSGLWDYTDLKKNEDISRIKITAYFEENEANEKFSDIEERYLNLQKEFEGEYGEIICKRVADEDWENSWKEYFHTEKIGERIVIRPPWEEYAAKENEVVIAIDPGAAFGTGQHPTTALALRALEKYVKSSSKVFDIGAGSGVLSIAAKKLGAKRVEAYDYDAVAVRIARENAALNGIEDLKIEVSDLFQNVAGTADIIVANIIADIILKLLPDIPEKLNKGGVFIAGGIIDERYEEVLDAMEKVNLNILEISHNKGWSLIVAEKKDA